MPEYDDAGKALMTDQELEQEYERQIGEIEQEIQQIIDMSCAMPDMPKHTRYALAYSTAEKIKAMKDEVSDDRS